MTKALTNKTLQGLHSDEVNKQAFKLESDTKYVTILTTYDYTNTLSYTLLMVAGTLCYTLDMVAGTLCYTLHIVAGTLSYTLHMVAGTLSYALYNGS